MTPRKILFVITKSNFGGAARHVLELASHFKALGDDVAVALGGKGVLVELLGAAGIRTISIDSMERDVNVKKEIKSFLKLLSIIYTEKPDILHVHSTKAGFLGSLAGRLVRVPQIIFTAHGWAFNEDRPLREKTVIAAVSWLTVLLATDIINISSKEYDQTLLFPGTGKKTHLVYNGISSEALYSHKNARTLLEKMAGISLHKKICLGTIGELHANKGQLYLLHAMTELVKLHPNIYLIIIGEGELRTKFEAYIAEHKLEQHVFLAGFVTDASLYIRGFDIFVFPSLKEGLPYAILEAGSAGLPVVSTSVGGIPEIIDDMKSGILIQPKNSKEIVNAVEFFLENPTTLKEYAHNLHTKITAQFSRDTMFKKLEKIYSSAVRRIRS